MDIRSLIESCMVGKNIIMEEKILGIYGRGAMRKTGNLWSNELIKQLFKVVGRVCEKIREKKGYNIGI